MVHYLYVLAYSLVEVNQMKFKLEHNLLSHPLQSWQHAGTFHAKDQAEADNAASRWSVYHGHRADAVRAIAVAEDDPYQIDKWMSRFLEG